MLVIFMNGKQLIIKSLKTKQKTQERRENNTAAFI